ncbi:dnaJ homolog subfamily C member 30 [Anoplophora glabripennis]|uniref:dnaJ homolog subfamily C member 30 n=1 Tax=Anoplophora glabripennis TaxID=217634 RepID=UPI000874DCCB|nr:dnaJ homolog subfamily C member 30 [Anoplophora glabripennis]XP_018560961.1 dnaJ homolog subfamily C member 30 [Anoplophora glabripennis]
MNFKMSYFRFTQKQIRFLSSKSKNHYESLGIPSSSTQSEVKTAYYKLSMQYHPDKSQSTESSQKFRDITEAYKVLGNAKTRKLYDKGLYFGGAASVTTDDSTNKFHKSRETRSRPPPPTGRTPIYDYDEWSRSHYGATFQRQMAYKRRMRMHNQKREQDLNDVKLEKLLFVLGLVLAICMYLFRDKTDYDEVSYFSLRPSKPKTQD